MIDLKKKEPEKNKKEPFLTEYENARLLQFVFKSMVFVVFIFTIPLIAWQMPKMVENIAVALSGEEWAQETDVIIGQVQEKLLVDEDYVIFIADEEYYISGGDWIHLQKGDSVRLDRNLWQSFNYQVEVLEAVENDN